jgi:hypothetical protein
LGLYNDPAYQEAKTIRQASMRNISMVLVDEYLPVDVARLHAPCLPIPGIHEVVRPAWLPGPGRRHRLVKRHTSE